jgi:hypothetical protein
MRVVPSPNIGGLRLFDILENAVKKYNHRNKIVPHLKYRDDGFMIMNANGKRNTAFFEQAYWDH